MRSATYDADIEKMYGTADADLTFTETAGKIKLTNSGYGYSYYPTGLDAIAIEVKALFSNSEQGVWYDPSDLTTLYQDAAGTTPVTAMEQPVGLILDKSRGLVLGAEMAPLVTSLTGWTVHHAPANGSVTSEPGGIRYTANGNGTLALSTGPILTSTKTYEVVLRVSDVYGFLYTEYGPGGASFAINTAGTYIYKINGRTTFYFRNIGAAAAAAGCLIEHVSIRELSGNHAFQSTSASRPVLSARKNWLVGTETLATQNVTTKALPYVLSFWGTGTIELTGTSTAGPLVGTSANNRVYLEFTPTAGTLTVTVSGTVSKAQLEIANESV